MPERAVQQTHRRVVAAFDFDGTVTRRDTLLPFLRFLCGARAVTETMLRHSARLSIAVALDQHARRAELKEQVLRELLVGRTHDEVRTAGELFARRLRRGSRLRPDVLSRWRWHRRQGHEVVVVSASLDAYVGPFCRLMGGMGSADVLATRLTAGADGSLTGGFDGLNCRGAEKMRRLHEWGLEPDAVLWAYGNSSGDRELLDAAHVPHSLGRRGRLPSPPATTRHDRD